MHILLPPSETKRFGGGSIFVPGSLAHDRALRETRDRVREALTELSSDEEAAAKALKLGVKNRDEVARNLVLDSSGAMPAIERYTGVLYDALDVASLDGAAREWLSSHVSVQSALFGLLRADDEIPAYRLSGASRLSGLGSTLKRVWAEAHGGVEWQQFEWMLDLRSKDYVALAPMPDGVGAWLHVAQRADGGAVRALNHFNKAAKGDLVRRLAQSGARIGTEAEFIEWAASHGLEVVNGPHPGELTLITGLGAPGAAARQSN